MPESHTVGPDREYALLALWEDYADDQATADQWAECYTGNLGAVGVYGWASTPTADARPMIYAAPGHAGSAGGEAGAHIKATGWGASCLNVYVPYTVVEGLGLSNDGVEQRPVRVDADHIVFRQLHMSFLGNTGSYTALVYWDIDTGGHLTLENCHCEV